MRKSKQDKKQEIFNRIDQVYHSKFLDWIRAETPKDVVFDNESPITKRALLELGKYDARFISEQDSDISDEKSIVSGVNVTGQETPLEKIWSSRHDCGRKMVKLKCKSCGREHIRVYECGSRICPTCAKKMQKYYYAKIKRFQESFKMPYGMSFKHITLSLKKRGFEFDVPRAIKALGKLHHNLLEKYGVGSLAHLELSPSGMVHWHILFIGKYIPVTELRYEWFYATGDSYMVDISRAEGDKAILEVLKYVTKFSETPDNMLYAFYCHIKNRRTLRTYGVLLDFENNDELFKLVCECGCSEWKFIEIYEPDSEHIPEREAG